MGFLDFKRNSRLQDSGGLKAMIAVAQQMKGVFDPLKEVAEDRNRINDANFDNTTNQNTLDEISRIQEEDSLAGFKAGKEDRSLASLRDRLGVQFNDTDIRKAEGSQLDLLRNEVSNTAYNIGNEIGDENLSGTDAANAAYDSMINLDMDPKEAALRTAQYKNDTAFKDIEYKEAKTKLLDEAMTGIPVETTPDQARDITTQYRENNSKMDLDVLEDAINTRRIENDAYKTSEIKKVEAAQVVTDRKLYNEAYNEIGADMTKNGDMNSINRIIDSKTKMSPSAKINAKTKMRAMYVAQTDQTKGQAEEYTRMSDTWDTNIKNQTAQWDQSSKMYKDQYTRDLGMAPEMDAYLDERPMEHLNNLIMNTDLIPDNADNTGWLNTVFQMDNKHGDNARRIIERQAVEVKQVPGMSAKDMRRIVFMAADIGSEANRNAIWSGTGLNEKQFIANIKANIKNWKSLQSSRDNIKAYDADVVTATNDLNSARNKNLDAKLEYDRKTGLGVKTTLAKELNTVTKEADKTFTVSGTNPDKQAATRLQNNNVIKAEKEITDAVALLPDTKKPNNLVDKYSDANIIGGPISRTGSTPNETALVAEAKKVESKDTGGLFNGIKEFVKNSDLNLNNYIPPEQSDFSKRLTGALEENEKAKQNLKWDIPEPNEDGSYTIDNPTYEKMFSREAINGDTLDILQKKSTVLQANLKKETFPKKKSMIKDLLDRITKAAKEKRALNKKRSGDTGSTFDHLKNNLSKLDELALEQTKLMNN